MVKLKGFKKSLIEAVSNESGCRIQYNGCPCNTCFHNWSEDELGLNGDLSHLFWMVVLALRGDYTQDEILKSNIDNFKDIIKKYKKGRKHGRN